MKQEIWSVDVGAAIEAQQVKVAELRGQLGRMRRAMVEARNLLLRHEHIAPVTATEKDALSVLSAALNEETK